MAQTDVQRPQDTTSHADAWELNTDQMIFMLQHQNAIQAAFDAEDMAYLRDLAQSAGYQAVFGAMSIDEALDRYDCLIA